jgi:hypothetical protein
MIKLVDIAGRREFPIPGMPGYAHFFSDIILYPALPGLRTERVKAIAKITKIKHKNFMVN